MLASKPPVVSSSTRVPSSTTKGASNTQRTQTAECEPESEDQTPATASCRSSKIEDAAAGAVAFHRFLAVALLAMMALVPVHTLLLAVIIIMNEDSTDNNTSTSSILQRLAHIEKEIDALQQRNFEKDRGKDFETSYTRVFFLMFVTYWTLFAYMYIIGTNQPFLDAIVPTLGFNISTWSLPLVKEWWIQARHYYRHGESEATSLARREESNNRSSRDFHQDIVDIEEGASEEA
jgi:hypothetical protein